MGRGAVAPRTAQPCRRRTLSALRRPCGGTGRDSGQEGWSGERTARGAGPGTGHVVLCSGLPWVLLPLPLASGQVASHLLTPPFSLLGSLSRSAAFPCGCPAQASTGTRTGGNPGVGPVGCEQGLPQPCLWAQMSPGCCKVGVSPPAPTPSGQRAGGGGAAVTPAGPLGSRPHGSEAQAHSGPRCVVTETHPLCPVLS